MITHPNLRASKAKNARDGIIMYAQSANEDASIVDTVVQIDPSPVIFSAHCISIVIRAPSNCVFAIQNCRKSCATCSRHPTALHAFSHAARFQQSHCIQSNKGTFANLVQ